MYGANRKDASMTPLDHNRCTIDLTSRTTRRLSTCCPVPAPARPPAEAQSEAEQVSVVQSEVVLCVNQLPHQDVEQ